MTTAAPEPEGSLDIEVTSLYGAQSHRPLVRLAIGASEWFMAPGEARVIAALLVECAEAACGDGFLIDFLTEEVGVDLPQAAGALGAFRAWRDAEEARYPGAAHAHRLEQVQVQTTPDGEPPGR